MYKVETRFSAWYSDFIWRALVLHWQQSTLLKFYNDVNVILEYYSAVLTFNIPTVSSQSHNSVFIKVLTYETVHYKEQIKKYLPKMEGWRLTKCLVHNSNSTMVLMVLGRLIPFRHIATLLHQNRNSRLVHNNT